MVTQPSSRPRGFTLIELLVVLSIIGILVALLVPAIYAARISALNFRISSEIAQLSQAVDEYKNSFGDFPPNPTNEALLRRHLAKRQRIDPGQVTQFVTYLEGGSGKPLDPAEALVFWLGGQSPNGSLHNNPVAPLQTNADPSLRTGELKSFFAFDQTRLLDRDGDGWLEYSVPGGTGAPYVYFESRSYAAYTASPFTIGMVNSIDRGKTAPYVSGNPAAPYVEPGRFQIIAAGLDGLYGVGGQVYPAGPYASADRDNLANFSAGKTFQDAVP